MIIRTAQHDDVPGILALWQERQALLAHSDPRFRPVPGINGERERQIDTQLRDPNYVIFIAQITMQAGISGYIAGHLSDGCGKIEDMALDAHQYHSGLGRLLVKSMRNWLVERTITELVIRVPRFHAVEQAFWRSMGAHELSTDLGKDEVWTASPAYIVMRL